MFSLLFICSGRTNDDRFGEIVWDIRMRVECVSPKSIDTSLNLTMSTRLC